MGTIKDKNGRDLVAAEEIKKKWKEYMEELYKKILINWVTTTVWSVTEVRHPGVCRWSLRSSGCDEIPAELFRSLKDDAVKVLHSFRQQIWKPSSGHRTGKGQSSSQFARRVVPESVLTVEQPHSSPVLVRSRLEPCLLGFSIM